MRKAGRGVAHFVRCIFPLGWSFKDCNVAFDQMHKRVALIAPPCASLGTRGAAYMCTECGCGMDTPGLVVADAGQAFEALDRDEIVKTLQHMTGVIAHRSGATTVTVMHTRQSHTFAGGTPKSGYSDRTVFKFETLMRMLYAFLAMRIYRFADAFVLLTNGIPIGGPLSGHILEAVLARCEHMYDIAHPGRARTFATGRIADDVYIPLSERMLGLP